MLFLVPCALLKVKSGGLDGTLIVTPLLTCNASPSVTDSLLREYNFGLVEDVLPDQAVKLHSVSLN